MTTTDLVMGPSIKGRVGRKLTVKAIPLLMLGVVIASIDRANLGVIAAPLSLPCSPGA